MKNNTKKVFVTIIGMAVVLLWANSVIALEEIPIENSISAESLIGIKAPFVDQFNRTTGGALKNNWLNASTWKIEAGKAVNAPILGSEMLADPSLETSYNSGLASSLVKGGDPIVSQSSDAYSGSSAQKFQASAVVNNLRFAPVSLNTSAQWLRFAVWGKRTEGVSGRTGCAIYSATLGPGTTTTCPPFISPDYTESQLFVRSNNNSPIYSYPVYEMSSGGHDEVVVDDASLKPVDVKTMFAFRPVSVPNVAVRIAPDIKDGVVGVVVRADSVANPQNFIVGYINRRHIYMDIVLEKVVNGTWTTLISTAITSYDPLTLRDQVLEVRASDSSVSIWYNGVQYGATQTISDPTILKNKMHGMFAAGKSKINGFALVPNLLTYSVEYAGSSITTLNFYNKYQGKSRDWLTRTYIQKLFSFGNQAVSGRNTWNNLIRWPLEGKIQNPQLVILDYANDGGRENDKRSAEAFIRRIWISHPNARIIAMNFFAVADPNVDDPTPTPSTQGGIDVWKTLLAYYKIPIVDYQKEVTRLVSEGHHLTEYFGDTIHPNDGGHELAYSLLTSHLTWNFLNGPRQRPNVLPPRLFDDGSYENTPVIKTGQQYDSRDGTWTDEADGSIRTMVPGSTVTFSCTRCISAGITPPDNASYINEVSVDGGSFSSYPVMAPNGDKIAEKSGSHTVTIKLVSGVLAISKFMSL